MEEKSDFFKDLFVVVLLSILVFFGALFIFSEIKKNHIKSQTYSLRTHDAKINKEVNNRIQILEAQLKLKKGFSKAGNIKNGQGVDRVLDLNQGQLDLYEAGGKTIEASSDGSIADKTLQIVDQAEMAEEQKRAVLQEYKREFIRRAQADGWDVQLDDNLNVISAKEIKR